VAIIAYDRNAGEFGGNGAGGGGAHEETCGDWGECHEGVGFGRCLVGKQRYKDSGVRRGRGLRT